MSMNRKNAQRASPASMGAMIVSGAVWGANATPIHQANPDNRNTGCQLKVSNIMAGPTSAGPPSKNAIAKLAQ